MIKFFRKIRQNLLSKNKIGKYLLYAFGEIILVIIGILIALNLNKQSEQKQAEAKIDAIFEDVLKNLETDINESKKRVYEYKIRDSVLSIILNTDLTYEDYADKNNDHFWRIPLTVNPYYVSDNGYRVLMDNLDAIPEKYNESVSLLNSLYSKNKRSVEKYNNKLEEHVENSNDILVEMPWFTHSNWKKSNEAIAYRLNDFRYKNRVRKYRMIAINNSRTFIVRYRSEAIKCYKEIASVLNKPVNSLDFIINEDVLQRYVGTYVNNTDPELKAELSINENGFLRVTRRNLTRPDEALRNVSSENIFSSYGARGGVFTFSKSDLGNSITLTIHEGHIPVTYTKINP